MSLPQGINFRGSSGYATDGADEDYELATTANYPRTSAQGNNVGWEDAVDLSLDRDNTVNDRIRGSAFTDHSAGAHRYRIDLGSSGNHLIKLAMGDVAGAATEVYAELFDDTSSLGALADKTSISSSIVDESNALKTPANWAADYSASGITATFSSTICRIKIGDVLKSGWCPIAHFYVEREAAAGNPWYAYAQM